jgi:predicted HD phosphohydrolase
MKLTGDHAMHASDTPRAGFHNMKDGTADDWSIIAGEFMQYAAQLPDRIIDHLHLLRGDCGGFPVDRLTHCLQTATLAHKDGRDEEYVICALLHDIGDTLGSYNHADVAAVLLEPFVSEANHWMVKHHAIFQGYYFFHHLGMDRDMYRQFEGHPHYQQTLDFVELYDSPAFNPDAETYTLDFFEPALRRVMAAPKRSLYRSVTDQAPA